MNGLHMVASFRVGLIFATIWALCFTAANSVSAPPGMPTVDAAILHGTAVYLAKVDKSTGHFFVEQVWRHDPSLGPAPAIGSLIPKDSLRSPRPDGHPAPRPDATLPDRCVVFLFAPKLDGTPWNNAAVYNDYVPFFKLSVSDLHNLVISTKWIPSSQAR
jgi:hypothetical protein